MTDFSRGSIWRKWDLHIHSPSTVLNNQFAGQNIGEKWENYLLALEEKDDIAVLGITDYFSINGYKKIRNFKNSGRIPNIPLILPNVELRLIPVTSDPTAINYHFIFSEEIVDRLDSIFFSEIEFEYDGNTYKCIEEDIIRLGKAHLGQVVENHIAYKEGINQFKIDSSAIPKLLKKNKDLRNNCITGVSNSSRDGVSGIQHNSLAMTRNEIYRSANIIFSGNQNDRKYFLGYGIDDVKTLISKYDSIKPCIIGSDAHSIEGICERLTWIKADPSFEGLKQILYEPDLRVRIQEHNPEETETFQKNKKFIIELPGDLKIKDDEKSITNFCMQGTYGIQFSNNLTCIIGGRGTGKSTIVHLLYNIINTSQDDRLQKINSPLTYLELIPSPLKRLKEITFADTSKNTEFFFQNEIESAAKNINTMSILLNQRFNKLSQIDEGKTLTELEETHQQAKQKLIELTNAFNSIVSLNKSISDYKEENNTLTNQTEIIKSDEYKKLKSNIEKLSSIIANHTRYLEENQILIEGIDNLLSVLNKIDWDKAHGKTNIDSLEKYLNKQRKYFNNNSVSIHLDFEKNDYYKQLQGKKDELKEYLIKRNMPPENIEELADATELIKDNEKNIKQLEDTLKPLIELYKNKNKYIEDYQVSFDKFKERNISLTETIGVILKGKSLSNKEISFVIKIDYHSIHLQVINYIIDSVDFSVRKDHLKNILFKDHDINYYISKKENIFEQINDYGGAEQTKPLLLELYSNDDEIEKLYLNMIRNCYDIKNIKIQTKLGTTPIQNTSFGERCGIVIAIIISVGTTPIVIDQPEDNLDGRFTTEVLVPLLREKKFNRQIILITRDANIVVGGDSELVNILEKYKGNTRIAPASIENLDFRDNYIWILDGGREAFIKREEKYGLSNN